MLLSRSADRRLSTSEPDALYGWRALWLALSLIGWLRICVWRRLSVTGIWFRRLRCRSGLCLPTTMRWCVADLLAGDANSGGLWHRSEPAGDALDLAGIVQLARRDRRLQLGVEDHEVPAQPVDQPRPLGHEDLAVIAQQPDLDGLLVKEGGGELLDTLAQHRTGDRASVGLAPRGPTPSQPYIYNAAGCLLPPPSSTVDFTAALCAGRSLGISSRPGGDKRSQKVNDITLIPPSISAPNLSALRHNQTQVKTPMRKEPEHIATEITPASRRR